MESLPNEIIEFILKNPILSIIDVVNFSTTNSKFREITVSSTSIWKSKYFQCWPKTDVDIISTDWYNECVSRKKFESKVLKLLSTMSSKFYNTDIKNINSIQLDFIVGFINSHKYGYFYLRDFLIEINSLPLSQSLTNKYYGSILLKFINKRYYTQVWNDLLQLSSKEQTLEKGAIFATLWCEDNKSGISKAVMSDLDYTADLVRQHLLQAHKDHPLKNVPEEILLTWRRENLPGNMFEPHHCRSIIDSINNVLFDRLKYCIVYSSHDLGRSKGLIDEDVLLRRATPLIFAVIYESVARRLGVRIEVLDFMNHCLLKWKEHYEVENTPHHYISMSNNGMFVKTGTCPRNPASNRVIPPCNMQQIAQKAASNIFIRLHGENYSVVIDTIELVLVVMPFNLEWYQLLGRVYMSNEMDARELIAKIIAISSQMSKDDWIGFEPLLHSLESYQKTWEHEYGLNNKISSVKRRTDDNEFAVGMIVRDKRTDHTGVICGWEKTCRAPYSYNYKVLLGGGSRYHYVSQENLQILHSPPFVSHPFIGRFFEDYCTTYYKPNKELREEYPDDIEALQKILRKDREP